MHSITDILNLLLKSIFVGFGFIIPILALIKTSDLKSLRFRDLFILTAVQTVRVCGIVYFILALVAAYPLFAHSGSEGPVKVDFTSFALYILFSPFMYLMLSQTFWIKRMYMRKVSLITLALLLLLLPSAAFLAVAKSQDVMPVLKGMFSGVEILKTLISCVIFFFIIFTIMLLGGKLKDKKD